MRSSLTLIGIGNTKRITEADSGRPAKTDAG